MDAIAALQVINGVSQSLNNNNTAKRQQEYQLELMGKANEYNQAAVNRQIEGEKEIFDYTSYKRRVDQLKEAGLNPGLIYGMGAAGGGGVTGNVSAPSQGAGSAPNMAAFAGNKIAQEGMMLNLAKLKSEIDVNKSIAEANKAEASLKAGAITEKTVAETESIKTTIDKIVAETKSEGLKQDGMRLQNSLNKLELIANDATIEDKIDKIKSESSKAYYQMQSAIGEMKSDLAKGTVDVASMETLIKQYNATLFKTTQDALLTQKNTQKSDAEIKEILSKVQQEWNSLEYDNTLKKAHIAKILSTMYNENDKEASELLSKGLSVFDNLIPVTVIKK